MIEKKQVHGHERFSWYLTPKDNMALTSTSCIHVQRDGKYINVKHVAVST